MTGNAYDTISLKCMTPYQWKSKPTLCNDGIMQDGLVTRLFYQLQNGEVAKQARAADTEEGERLLTHGSASEGGLELTRTRRPSSCLSSRHATSTNRLPSEQNINWEFISLFIFQAWKSGLGGFHAPINLAYSEMTLSGLGCHQTTTKSRHKNDKQLFLELFLLWNKFD